MSVAPLPPLDDTTHALGGVSIDDDDRLPPPPPRHPAAAAAAAAADHEDGDGGDEVGGAPLSMLPLTTDRVPPAKPPSSSSRNGPARRWSCETCRKRKIKCDGIRPTCGFCARKNILPCVFVGTKDRADVDLARQFEAERRRRRLIKQILAAPAVPARAVKKTKSTPSIGIGAPPGSIAASPPVSVSESSGSDAHWGIPNSSFLGLATPILNGYGPNISTVQPMCNDDLWFSSVDPIKLEHLYNQDRRPEKNLLTFRTQLADISNHIYAVSTPEPLKTMDWSAISAVERRLEQDLQNHWGNLPPEFKMELTEDWLFETIDRDFYLFDSVVGHFISFHGARSHLMRRRGLLYLQEVSASLAGAPVSPDDANRVALQKGLSSAVAMAKLLELLMNTPGAIHRFPKFSISTVVRGSTMLLMAEGLVPAFTDSPRIGDIANDVNPAHIPKHIDTYVAFLHAMASRSKMATSLLDVIQKMRSSDWNVIETLCAEPSKIHSIDVTVDGLDQDPAFMGVWPRRVRVLSLVIRDCLSSIRTARTVSDRMSPLAAASSLAKGATDVATRGHGPPFRPLSASRSWGDVPLLSRPQFWGMGSGLSYSSQAFGGPVSQEPETFSCGEEDVGGTGDAAWLENEPPLADNPDDGDDAMVLLDWLFATDPKTD
ncbi:hypothetical protein DFJ73DRAFT_775385 [Zopfochytrium polystomum]|nr:hypothetical protein DFJ73DRAFT_775385 [Zopfochytrium polystomum]